MRLDGRTKLLALVWGILLIAFSPGIDFEVILVCSVLVLAALAGLLSFGIKTALFYAGVLLFQHLAQVYAHGATGVMCISFFMLIRKLIPGMVLGGILILTTRVNEFMFSMEWFRFPKALSIAFAVMLRYFPCIRQDFNAVREAMAMRGLSLSAAGFIKAPLRSVECLYVPIMLSASRLADELSAAGAARGIENPGKRTCLHVPGFHLSDLFCLLLFCSLTVVLVLMQLK